MDVIMVTSRRAYGSNIVSKTGEPSELMLF